MNEPVLIFGREWAVTIALASVLTPILNVSIIPAFDLDDLDHKLVEYRKSPIILGISPHEHVAPLYQLRKQLSGRCVLFVARRFWWADYCLPAFAGIEWCEFCTLDNLVISRDETVQNKSLIYSSWGDYANCFAADKVSVISDIPPEDILYRANLWLQKHMRLAGLSGVESMVLIRLSENAPIRMSPHRLSYYKLKGLSKLGMSKHVVNLYRGVKVRPELQMPFLSADNDCSSNRRY
ncbi:hypothetical protein QDX91_004526 [Salmonella enterica]|nr:hypothetical protein [Salmonella enterica subsp. enterica serovar Sandiego]EEC0251885.1 hypothetical protein [Salmonella enterica subsp. enterica]EJW2129088.1 hypothetical protein [Salmonella enterica]EEE4266612.1 hypothetical protein [Salmonella enterica subsp. enterica serovar Sandiego]EKT1705020.1 hypothetical protein [Salmonella enterica]